MRAVAASWAASASRSPAVCADEAICAESVAIVVADRAPSVRHVALATDRAGQDRVREHLDRLGIPYQAERHRDSDSIYFADPDGLMLEVMVPTA